MITVTEQLKNVFEANPLYSKEGQGLNAEVIARFFLPFSSVVWLVTEAEQQEDGDWLFFGYCHIQEWEWGYVLLSVSGAMAFSGVDRFFCLPLAALWDFFGRPFCILVL